MKTISQVLSFLVWSIYMIRWIWIVKCLALLPPGPCGWGQNCQKLTTSNFHLIASSLFPHKLEKNSIHTYKDMPVLPFYLTFPLLVPNLYGRMQLPKFYTSSLHYSSFMLWIYELESKFIWHVFCLLFKYIFLIPLFVS